MQRRHWGLLCVAAMLLVPAAASLDLDTLVKEPDPDQPLVALDEGGAPMTAGPEVPGVTSSRYADKDRNRIFDGLDQSMAENPQQEAWDVVVLLNEAPTDGKMAELKSSVGPFVVNSYKDDPSDPEGRPWTIVDGFAAELTQVQIKRLAAREDVQQIEPVLHTWTIQMNTARDESGVNKAQTDFGVNGDRTGAIKTYTKDDIVICVIDTGIEDAHADLNEGQVIGWKDYVNARTDHYDDNGHGTHVAATAAGQGDESTSYRGVAQGAGLVGVKVLNNAGGGSTTNIVNGINWCKDNKATYGIEVMSLSLGGGTCTSGTDSMSAAVNNAVDAGIVVTVAAGNSGPGYCTIGDPGAASKVITVGAVSDPDNAACGGYLAKGWYLVSFSSRGLTGDGRYKPEIAAPGVCITSADNDGAGYVTMSGTSMATPFVAGVVALMLDADPAETPATIKSALMSTSRDAGPNNQNAEPQSYDWGAGVVDAHTAVENVCGCGAYNAPGNPTIFPRTEDLGGTGSYDRWALSGVGTSRCICITLIIPSASGSKDFDVRLYDPNGNQVASSLGTTRQETISYTPGVTGTFKVRVESYTGSGSYWLDVSASAAGLAIEVDQ